MSSPSPRVRFAADYPTGAIRPLRRSGALTRLRRGAYVPTNAETDTAAQVLDRCVAVARQLRTRFAFSDETAAVLHGLPTWYTQAERVHLVQQTRPAGSSAQDLIRHVVSDLPQSDITQVHDLPVTTLERTCVDCARRQHPAYGLAVADAVLRRLAHTTRFNWPETAEQEQKIRAALLSRLDELGPARGIVRARAVLTHAQGRSESPAESRLRWLVLCDGLVEPDLQVAIHTPEGRFYPDMLWSGNAVRSRWRAVALEYDGVAKYEASQDLYQEKLREDALRSAGCLVIRCTKTGLNNPEPLLSRLRKHIAIQLPDAPERRGLRLPR